MRSARAPRVPCGCATRPGRGCCAGSSGALRVRHASRAQVPRGLTECPASAPRVLGARAARAHRVPCECATRPGRGCRAGSSGALRARLASGTRVPRGLTECHASAPRVLGASAARAHRVPCGCAPRPGGRCRAGSPSALRVRRASPFRECPNDLLEGAARWRVPKGPGRAEPDPAPGRTWASSILVGLVGHCLSPIGLTGHIPVGNLRAVVWEPRFPYHRQCRRRLLST